MVGGEEGAVFCLGEERWLHLFGGEGRSSAFRFWEVDEKTSPFLGFGGRRTDDIVPLNLGLCGLWMCGFVLVMVMVDWFEAGGLV